MTMPPPDASRAGELRELLARATPGPWYAQERDDGTLTGVVRSEKEMEFVCDCDSVPSGLDDAALIVALRSTTPGLLDIAEKAREAADVLRTATCDCDYGDPDGGIVVCSACRARDIINAALGGAK